ncbi:PQ-loop repeat-containing protein [bacterium]|nr:PQ-loop repeat-containing protein [bacterium]
MTWIFEILGFVGIGISCFAYVPQIVHLIKEHCSEGISVKAWLLWLLASILIFLHAVQILDAVFITLQGANTAAITLIIVLSKRYQNMLCEGHRP